MPAQDASQWKALYQAAIQENNPAKAAPLIDQAYEAAHDRLGQLLSEGIQDQKLNR